MYISSVFILYFESSIYTLLKCILDIYIIELMRPSVCLITYRIVDLYMKL